MTKTQEIKNNLLTAQIERNIKKAIRTDKSMFFISEKKFNPAQHSPIAKKIGIYFSYVDEYKSYVFWFDDVNDLNLI